ncbi:MAG: transporter substrate-binding domain-containing protein [Paucibacter sp.]|nr:transporter substrate-binding domain-containing protein [Roseateles sp.]
MNRRHVAGLLASSLVEFPWSASGAEPLGIAYFTGSARSKIGALIMVEVYRQAGIATVPVSYPGARNLVAAEASEVVGESVRVYSYTDAHPLLTRVEPAVTEWTTVAFYRTGGKVRIQSPMDLRGLAVGYTKGTRACEDLVRDLELKDVQVTASPEQLFRMLMLGRFDVALEGGTNGALVIRRDHLSGLASFELNRLPLYHVLSPKYKAWAPMLSEIITRMRASGELARVAAQAEQAVLSSDEIP